MISSFTWAMMHSIVSAAAAAGKKAFVVNRIGDFGFALGMFLIWTTYGTDEDGINPEDDLHLRLTFFLDLE